MPPCCALYFQRENGAVRRLDSPTLPHVGCVCSRLVQNGDGLLLAIYLCTGESLSLVLLLQETQPLLPRKKAEQICYGLLLSLLLSQYWQRFEVSIGSAMFLTTAFP